MSEPALTAVPGQVHSNEINLDPWMVVTVVTDILSAPVNNLLPCRESQNLWRQLGAAVENRKATKRECERRRAQGMVVFGLVRGTARHRLHCSTGRPPITGPRVPFYWRDAAGTRR